MNDKYKQAMKAYLSYHNIRSKDELRKLLLLIDNKKVNNK